jgi:starch synthase
LQQRRDNVYGILNGVDYDVWDPQSDSYLAANYSHKSWRRGKALCKAALQADLELPAAPRTPLIGLIGRLVDQKGWDLVADVIQRWVEQVDAQWVILGTGEPKYHSLLRKLATQHANRVAARLEFSDRLAHQIEAASDLFLMPSHYEPCGLNQLYSLRYGAVPVVRFIGGLADSICDATSENLRTRKANGFCFEAYEPAALEEALLRAVSIYQQQPDVWAQLVETGMQQDWSWEESAAQYVALYERIVQQRQRQRSQIPATGSTPG